MHKPNLIRSLAIALAVTGLASPLVAGPRQEKTVLQARWVYEQLLKDDQRKVPQHLMAETRCIAIFPGIIKAAFIFGGSHGTGVVSCRNPEGQWSPPSFIKISQGSFGAQIGYKASDMVLFFISERGAQALLESRLSFGGAVSVAAGPAAKQAGTTSDTELSEDVYLYVKASGLFAGASVEGLQMGTSPKAIRKYYGFYVWPGEILFEHKVPEWPPESKGFVEGLNSISWPTPEDP